jgi:Flp pilus assembly protein TadD
VRFLRLTRQPRDWRVLSGLGVSTSAQGRQREAQQHFARALELSPNNPTILNNMAVSLILDRKVDEAEQMLKRAARAGAPRQQLVHNLALIRALKTEEGMEPTP